MPTTARAHRRAPAASAVRAGAAALASALVLTGCGLFSAAPKPKVHHAATPPPAPATVHGNGATLAKQSALGGVVGTIIDNEQAARPQSGLEHASLVFEAPAEGGITRFLALFWQNAAAKVGPIRSTRIYFDQLAQSYDIPLAHAGGNVDALKALKTLHIKNIDQIWTVGAAPFFYRTSVRQPPHNLYTSTDLLTRAVRSLGLTMGPVPTWSVGTPSGGKPATTVNVDFSSVEDARWLYQNGSYVRYEGSQIDTTLGGNEIRAKAVLVLYVGEAPDPDPYTPGSIKLLMTGSGKGDLAVGGRVVPVTWQRQTGKPFSILNASGGAEVMPAPPLWIELVPTGTPVTFGP